MAKRERKHLGFLFYSSMSDLDSSKMDGGNGELVFLIRFHFAGKKRTKGNREEFWKKTPSDISNLKSSLGTSPSMGRAEPRLAWAKFVWKIGWACCVLPNSVLKLNGLTSNRVPVQARAATGLGLGLARS